MKPEVYFVKYAFPCAHILYNVRGEITLEEFKKMEEAAVNSKVLDRAFLEKTFFRAFKRIEKIAQEMEKEKWDLETITEYFRERHNTVLDNSDYPESFKEMCKVFKSEVVKDLGKEAIVRYENKGERRRRIKKDYLPDLKEGDKVVIHWNYAVEKV